MAAQFWISSSKTIRNTYRGRIDLRDFLLELRELRDLLLGVAFLVFLLADKVIGDLIDFPVGVGDRTAFFDFAILEEMPWVVRFCFFLLARIILITLKAQLK